jgi:hypothetical protein
MLPVSSNNVVDNKEVFNIEGEEEEEDDEIVATTQNA